MAIVVSATIDSREALTGARVFNSALASMRAGVATTGRAIGGLVTGVFSLRGALAGIATIGTAKALVETADSFSLLRARLALVAQDGATADQVLAGVAAVAERSRAPVDELAQLYTRNAEALKNLGVSQSDSLRFTESLSKALTISGASGASASAALFQLSQSLNSGTLRGEEFNSVVEQAPEILRIISRETGKSAAELRKLAAEGKLTADVVVKSLLNASGEIDEKFSTIPQTAGQAFTSLASAASQAFGRIAEESGLSKAFADLFNDLREAISSPAFQNSAKFVADVLREIGEGFRVAAAFIAEARLAFIGWTQAISETTVFKALVSALGTVRDAVVSVGQALGSALAPAANSLFGEGTNFAAVADRAKDVAESQRLLESFRTTVTRGGSPLEASRPGAKAPIKFGKGEDAEAEKRATKIREQLARQVELERLKNDLTQAQARGETVIVTAIQNELDIKSRITAEQRKIAPELAKQLEGQILISNEIERQGKELEKARAVADDFSQTITDAFRSAAFEGGKFSDLLKDLGKRLLNLTLETAVFSPLQKSLSNSLAGSSLFSGLSNFGSTAFGFANGGVFNSPLAFQSGGIRGVLGERGPEAVLPLTRGADGRLGVASQGAAGGSQVININIAGDATERTVAEMRRVAREEFARGAPGVVRQSVSAVRDEHVRDPRFLRR